MDENQLIDYLIEEFPSNLELGIGDDCSIEKYGNLHLLVTKDLLIEDVHFRLSYMTPFEIGRKSVVVNVSDITAMGGIPKNIYLGLGIPGRFKEEDIKSLFKGVKAACQKWDLDLAGGDISRSEKLVISITVKGESEKPVLRKDAKVGDLICLSGKTGEASVGFDLLEKGIKPLSDPRIAYYLEKFINPDLDLDKAINIAKYANSMIDISDGVLLDLSRLLKASQKGAKIIYEKFPRNPVMTDLCQKYELNIQDKLLAGGEDYVLLFTLPEKKLIQLEKLKIKIYPIGEIVQNTGLKVFSRGEEIVPEFMGFDHFSTE